VTPPWLLEDTHHSFVHLLGEKKEEGKKKKKKTSYPSSGTKHTEHSISLLFRSQAGPKLVPGSLVFKSSVLLVERVYHKKIKGKSIVYIRLEINELLIQMTSVSTPLLWHLAGHTYKEISKLGDSLRFSYPESKAPKQSTSHLAYNTEKGTEPQQQESGRTSSVAFRFERGSQKSEN